MPWQFLLINSIPWNAVNEGRLVAVTVEEIRYRQNVENHLDVFEIHDKEFLRFRSMSSIRRHGEMGK
jgi:hypothetical protein